MSKKSEFLKGLKLSLETCRIEFSEFAPSLTFSSTSAESWSTAYRPFKSFFVAMQSIGSSAIELRFNDY